MIVESQPLSGSNSLAILKGPTKNDLLRTRYQDAMVFQGSQTTHAPPEALKEFEKNDLMDLHAVA